MSKYDPQRKGAYETSEEVQPVMERIDVYKRQICALLGDYGVPFALGASLGKEYGDEMSPCNKWDWNFLPFPL